MAECREFFERLDAECHASQNFAIRGDRVRAAGADRFQRLLDWENQQASRYSPGPVQAAELLRKALFQGRDIVEGTMPRVAFASLVDLGLSVDRLGYSDEEQSRARFERMATNAKPLFGYVDLEADDLRRRLCTRETGGEQVRAIGVYDTGIPENSAHAEAFMLVKVSGSKPSKSLQQDLAEYYRDRVVPYSPRS